MDSGQHRTLLQRYGLPPAEIEARSLGLMEQLAGPLLPSEPRARRVALMMLYAAGDPDLAARVVVHPAAVEAGLAALLSGRPIVTDVRMVAAAVEGERLNRLGSAVVCAIEHPQCADLARERGTTRAAAGMQLCLEQIDGAVAAVGNAPTALLALLDALDEGRVRPALVIGTPVGLVAASESKEELLRRDIPYVTVRGTRGGSALAAAATNALIRLAVGYG